MTIPRRPVGRPRSETARAAILGAAIDCVRAKGPNGVTIEDVARRAGVAKATIYRWWPGRFELIVDAFREIVEHVLPPDIDTGSLEKDILGRLTTAPTLYAHTGDAASLWLLALQIPLGSELHHKYMAAFVHPIRADHMRAFQRAIARGELPPDTDVELALDILHGTLALRMVHGHLPVNRRAISGLVRALLQGLGHRASPQTAR